jgi:hypothetical protein
MKKAGFLAASISAALFMGLGGLRAQTASPPGQRVHADVLQVRITRTAPGVFRFDVTISSPDTGWKKYANAFRVKTLDNQVLGTRILIHPHVNEQPFTRSLSGVKIPPDVRQVVVDARDSVAGWGGKTGQVSVPH